MSLRLYEIPIAWANLQELLEASAGEITPEIEAAWGALEEQGEAKVDATAAVIKSMVAEGEALATEIGRLEARKDALYNSVDRLKAFLVPALQALGGKVKTTRFTTYLQTRETASFDLKPDADIWELDAKFYRTREPELNKTALKDARKAGETLPDCIVVAVGSTTYPVIR